MGKPVQLRDWQQDDLRKIYDNPHGTRLAIISFGKKNGKSSLAAMLLLLHLAGPEAKANSQLPSTAQSKDQAAVLFKLAAKIVRLSPTLKPHIIIRDTVKELFYPRMQTLYKALSAEVSTAHGQSPIFAIHDELGQVRGPVSELYNAIDNAMGAHANPMAIIISTQAPNDGDLLSILIDDATKGEDPRTVISLYTADLQLDPFSDEALRQANPAFGDFLNADEVRDQALKAKRLRAQEPLYRNYTLNQRVEMNSPFIARSAWLACSGQVIESFKGLPVYGGLDLSAVADLTALVLVAPVETQWHVKPTFWLPNDGLRERARTDRAPYDVWHKDGFLRTTPAATIEYEFIAEYLRGLFDELDIRKIGFDRWNWLHLKPWLSKAGFSETDLDEKDENSKFSAFGQGFQSMSPALRHLEGAILSGRLMHGNHPVLTMCAGNAVVKYDDKKNRVLSKVKSTGRIDGMVALAMAMSVAGTYQRAARTKSFWETAA